MALTPEQRQARLDELKKAREEKAAEMAAERLNTRAEKIDTSATEYYGVTPVKVGASTQERVEALKDIRAAENLASYSSAPEFNAIPYNQLDPKIKGVISANAASSGMSPEEYYNARGGVNRSGYYGDSYTPGLTLSEREYQTARLEGGIGTTSAGEAINLASAKKAYDYYVAQGDNPVKASIRSGYTGTTFQVKQGIGRNGGNLYLYDGKYYDDAGNELPESSGSSVWKSSSVTTSTINPGTSNVAFSYSGTPFTSSNLSSSTNLSNTQTGPTLAKDVFKATMALYFGQAELAKGWMDELYNVVSKYYRNGVEVATAFNMALLDARNNPNLTAFTNRFKGIYALQDLRQAGKPVEVPTIAQYVASQIGMADVLKQANLSDLATEDFTGELIGKGNSVTTVAEKIAKAYQRIDMAPKAIKDTFSRYFPTVDRPTLARTILLGQKGVDELVDELAKFEVLAAAEQQGLGAITKAGGLTEERAMEYARAGGTYQSLLPKFGQIARALPDIQKLTGISRVADISQADVEKAVISQSEQELRRLEDISLQEEARFRAKAGRADIPLASQRRANRAY